MKILILGGTADARHICAQLHQNMPALELIYSVAGLVRQPQVPATVISGGFAQHGGLSHYCQAQNIRAIVDATHPYATTMAATALASSQQLGIRHWRFLRSPWQSQAGDQWHTFSSTAGLLKAMQGYTRILLTVGQVKPTQLDLLNQVPHVWLRTAVPPSVDLPSNVQWIKAIGPFDLANEQALLQQHQIQAIASKNSGGEATSAKLTAARDQGIPVYMLQRPHIKQQNSAATFTSIEHLISQVSSWQQTLTTAPAVSTAI